MTTTADPAAAAVTLSSSFREQGNDEYRKGNYLKAAANYTKAIKEEPEAAALYSNRSAALVQLNKLPKALADAEECIRLEPEWDKGYFRKGAALEAQDKLEEVSVVLINFLSSLKQVEL
jgi:tetratricopeptide (TPR) repeat protein